MNRPTTLCDFCDNEVEIPPAPARPRCDECWAQTHDPETGERRRPMKRVEFVVPGRPERWERTTEHEGQRKNTAAHKKAKANIAQHAWVAMVRARLKPFTGPVRLTVLAVYPRNKGCPTWVSKEAWATGRRLYLKRDPDLDNLAKLCFDAIQPEKALRGLPRPRAFCIGDDNQVCSMVADKVMAAVGEKPRTLVAVEELGECYSE